MASTTTYQAQGFGSRGWVPIGGASRTAREALSVIYTYPVPLRNQYTKSRVVEQSRNDQNQIVLETEVKF